MQLTANMLAETGSIGIASIGKVRPFLVLCSV